MSTAIRINGDRGQVSGEVWADWMDDVTSDEFMDFAGGDVESAVADYVTDLPDLIGEPLPTYYWVEANAPFTLAELLTMYLEDHRDEWDI